MSTGDAANAVSPELTFSYRSTCQCSAVSGVLPKSERCPVSVLASRWETKVL